MKLWIPISLAGVLVFALVFMLYVVPTLDGQGSTALSLTNAVGLGVVLLGVVAAGLVLMRGSPQSQ